MRLSLVFLVKDFEFLFNNFANSCLTREPSCNIDIIVEKQLKNSMSWTILLKILLLPIGIFCVSLALLLCFVLAISIMIKICYVCFIL